MNKDYHDLWMLAFLALLIFGLCTFLGLIRSRDLKQTICLNSTETRQAYNACMSIEFEDMKSRMVIDMRGNL